MIKAIIVDLDGTLCNVEHRLHYIKNNDPDYSSFHKSMCLDALNIWCHEILLAMKKQGYQVIFVTGRSEEYRSITISWLNKLNIEYDLLLMRNSKDNSDDANVKEKLYTNFIKEQYSILFVIDDRLSVVERWRKLGLVCLQCDWGDF